MQKITRRDRGRRTGGGAARHARHHPRAEHIQAGADRPAQRHGRPVSRRRRPRQPRRRRTGGRRISAARCSAGRSRCCRRDDQNKPDVASVAGARMDRQPGRRRAGGRRCLVVRPRRSSRSPREEAHLSDHRSGDVGHDRQAMLAVRHPFCLRHLRTGARHRHRADQGRRRHAGSSSPPTMRSAMRWSATPSPPCRRPAARCSGSVRAPLGTADFSSYLVQAKASGAKVIGFANAGTDLQNCIKQAAEFGMSQGGTRMATLLMAINDVHSLGQKTCEGLVYTELVLLGHDRQDPRLVEALERQDERHGARPAARRRTTAPRRTG